MTVIIKHIRSGNFYRLIGMARGTGVLKNRTEIAIYQQLDTAIDSNTGEVLNKGMYWAREAHDFHDKFRFPSSYHVRKDDTDQ